MELLLSLGGICLGLAIGRCFHEGLILEGILATAGLILLLIYSFIKSNQVIDKECELEVEISKLKRKLEEVDSDETEMGN